MKHVGYVLIAVLLLATVASIVIGVTPKTADDTINLINAWANVIDPIEFKRDWMLKKFWADTIFEYDIINKLTNQDNSFMTYTGGGPKTTSDVTITYYPDGDDLQTFTRYIIPSVSPEDKKILQNYVNKYDETLTINQTTTENVMFAVDGAFDEHPIISILTNTSDLWGALNYQAALTSQLQVDTMIWLNHSILKSLWHVLDGGFNAVTTTINYILG